MHIGVHLPEDLPCSSSGQQTKTQVMCSNQAIVSVVTTTNSSLYKASELPSHCVEEHIRLLAPHPCTCLSIMVELQVLEPSWREACCLRTWISAEAHPHEAFVFTAKSFHLRTRSDPRTDHQLRSQCGKWSSIGPTTKHPYTLLDTFIIFWGMEKNGPFLMSPPRPAKHLEAILTPDK